MATSRTMQIGLETTSNHTTGLQLENSTSTGAYGGRICYPNAAKIFLVALRISYESNTLDGTRIGL